jgi:hypothetical protein
MKLAKRSTEATVEKISNGFVVTLQGQDEDSNYATEKFYLEDMKRVSEVLSEFFFLPEY